MNILPKKSWHVRTKKNIERVHRDEAEAERVARIDEDRKLRAEQEARMRELRARAGLPETSGTQKHFNLFDGCQDSQQISNKEHEEEKRQADSKWEQKVGILKKLVRTEDVNQPWYCRSRSGGQSFSFQNIANESKTQKIGPNPGLITSIYDPMTAIKHAEQIVRQKRIEERKQIDMRSQANMQLQLYNYDFYKHVPPPPSFKPAMLPNNQPPNVPSRVMVQIDESDSSPEIIKEVKKDRKLSSSKERHRKRSKNKSKRSHKKSSRHKHHHKKHKKHKR